MVLSALAYSRGMLVKPMWDSKAINFQTTNTELKIPDTNEPKLIWDMRGIMRNRPDPFPLPFNPEQTYLDSGLKWGEEIIDLIMADRGRVIIPLRNLRGFDELDEALTYTEDAIIGIDWSNTVESISKDFSIDIVELLRLLRQRNQKELMIYCLTGDYPYIPAGAVSNLQIKVATLSEPHHPPSWAKEVFSFE